MSDRETMFEGIIKGGQLYHSLEVARNSKGYNWTVKVAGGDKEKIKEELVEIEGFCKDKYG